jgi:hypothetical protein
MAIWYILCSFGISLPILVWIINLAILLLIRQISLNSTQKKRWIGNEVDIMTNFRLNRFLQRTGQKIELFPIFGPGSLRSKHLQIKPFFPPLWMNSIFLFDRRNFEVEGGIWIFYNRLSIGPGCTVIRGDGWAVVLQVDQFRSKG